MFQKRVIKAYNEAKSELIAFLDADDEWTPNYLETILRLREKYPCAGLYATSIKNEFIDNALTELDEEVRKLVPKEGLILNYFQSIQKRACFIWYIFSNNSYKGIFRNWRISGWFLVGRRC